jgi:hypothetical protein
MFRSIVSLLALLTLLSAGAASAEPPQHPFLAPSSWPIFHRNTYAQASGELTAPSAGDRLSAQFLPKAKGGVSPWTVLLPPYTDRSQASIGSTRLGIVKHVFDAASFREVSFLPIPRGRFDFDWNLAVLRDGAIVTTSRRENAYYLVGDREPNCPQCPLEIKKRIVLPQSVGQITIQFTIAFDGTLIGLLEGNRMIAVSLATGQVLATHALPIPADEVGFHNAFPIDESGRLYLSSQRSVTAVDWANGNFKTAWSVPYDFRGPGCEKRRESGRLREALSVARGATCTGTGTTPTLIGSPKDGVVVMVDGHAPKNRLVAFWRNEIPADAPGVPGEDRRVAAVQALPYSTPDGDGFTAENSPAALGNSVFIAQWAGLYPDCDAPRGVQRVDWIPPEKRLALVWANPRAHFNGVPTVSARTGLVYGTGRGAGCAYHYMGLDIASGELRLDLRMADSSDYLDQGNQQTLAADGSILYASANGIVRISARR